MRTNSLTGYLALAAIIAATSTASAQDAPPPKVGDVSYHGYFRAGFGVSSEGGRQTCFQVNGSYSKYRLGNECDLYGEWLFSGPAYVGEDGVIARANVMFNIYIPTTGGGSPGYTDRLTPGGGRESADIHWGFNQFFFDFEKLPFLSDGARAWIGRRFYKRQDIHLTDFFWWNASGLGGGIEDIAVSGPMKLSYAAFVVDGPSPDAPAAPVPDRAIIGIRNDLRLYGIPAGPGGEIRLGVNAVIDASDGDVENTNNGFSGHGMYVLALPSLGGENQVGVQYAVGPAAGGNGVIDQLTTDTDRNFFRIVDNFFVQATPEFAVQATAVYHRDTFPVLDSDDTTTLDWISAGGRMSYAFNQYAQLLVEAGFDTTKPEGGDRRNLTKLTVAPVIAAGKGHWARPQLRIWGTYAFWNDAAREAGVDSAGIYTATDKTGGATFGIQSEAWW